MALRCARIPFPFATAHQRPYRSALELVTGEGDGGGVEGGWWSFCIYAHWRSSFLPLSFPLSLSLSVCLSVCLAVCLFPRPSSTLPKDGKQEDHNRNNVTKPHSPRNDRPRQHNRSSRNNLPGLCPPAHLHFTPRRLHHSRTSI